MFRGEFPHAQRQPRADPKRAWLDAIMSKSRQSDTSAASTSSTLPPSSALASRALPHERWQPPLQPPPSEPQRRRPSATAAVYQEQLEMDDALLAETMSLAFKRMVGEQTCCFIAKGICHICGTSERQLIPVVNFCPDFHVSHSLCREHLRSFYHVRMEDIFAGKHRPTVSKRSLKCGVCSRSCPCSTCLLEKQHEISKYKRWLAGEHEYGLDSEDRAAGLAPPPPLRSSQQPGADFGGPSLGSRPGYVTTDELHDQRGPPRRQEPYAPPPQRFESPWRAEFARGDAPEQLQSLQAGAKPPSHPSRGAKRAAKDTPMLAVQSPMPPPLPAVGEPVESPSAAHVMNCAESEKSLVRLLTTLNQDVLTTHEPSAAAEPKDSRSHPPNSKSSGSRRQSTRSEDNARVSESESTENRGYYVDTSVGEQADGSVSTSSSRNSKRKRTATARADSETSSESSATHSRGRRLPTPRRGEASTATRGPQSETPSSSRAAGKGKGADSRQRTTPRGSQGGRKRAADTPSNAAPEEKKGAEARRASSRRSPAKASQGRRAKKQPGRARKENEVDDAESGEESEIDTNLDYCEVCLAAGDLVCCDVCPRSFHLACLKLHESDLPEGDWQCAECRKPSFFVRYLALVHMKQSIYGKCVETLRCLKTHPFSKQFLSPVTNIDHYRSIVKHPMDLTTIETKLKADKYAKTLSQGDKSVDIETFANDVRLVWANCKLFNDDGSGITRAADELAAGFEDIYEHLQQYVATTTTQSAKPVSKPPSRGSRPASSRSVSPSPSSKADGAAQENQQTHEGDEAKTTTTSPATKDESGNQSAATTSPLSNSKETSTDLEAPAVPPPEEEAGPSDPSGAPVAGD